MTSDSTSMSPPLVCVVIPAFRRPMQLERAIASLFQQALPSGRFEAIVVDSSPDDEAAAVVKRLQLQAPFTLRYYRKKPTGPAASRNVGIRETRAEFIAFMDSDCEATPGWLEHGLAHFAPAVGLVQGRVLPDPTVPTGVLTFTLLIERETYAYECANIFYRRSALEEVGGFAEHFDSSGPAEVIGGEDLDVAWRVKRRGWESRFASDAVVYHEVRPMPWFRWLVPPRLIILPQLIRAFPELRQFFVGGYFYDRHHLFLTLGLSASAVALAGIPAAWLGWIPYIVNRAIEPTATLSGWKRPIRVFAYLAKDLGSLLILTAGTLRSRTILL